MLEQDAGEMLRLEAILDAFSRYEDHLVKKRDTRNRNRNRHAEVKETVVEE